MGKKLTRQWSSYTVFTVDQTNGIYGVVVIQGEPKGWQQEYTGLQDWSLHQRGNGRYHTMTLSKALAHQRDVRRQPG